MFLIVGGVFSLIGLYIIFGRFLFDAYGRTRTYYGVTDERVIHLVRGDARRLDGGHAADHTEVRRGEVLERSSEGAEARSLSRKNDDVARVSLRCHESSNPDESR